MPPPPPPHSIVVRTMRCLLVARCAPWLVCWRKCTRRPVELTCGPWSDTQLVCYTREWRTLDRYSGCYMYMYNVVVVVDMLRAVLLNYTCTSGSVSVLFWTRLTVLEFADTLHNVLYSPYTLPPPPTHTHTHTLYQAATDLLVRQKNFSVGQPNHEKHIVQYVISTTHQCRCIILYQLASLVEIIFSCE